MVVYGDNPFPILFQDYRLRESLKRMPRWDELTPWMKLQLSILVFSEFENLFETFSVDLNLGKTEGWLREGKDLRVLIRDRMRKELQKALERKCEFLFVIEGLSRKTKAQTKLHVHGGVVLTERSEADRALKAVERSAGQGLRNSPKEPRSSKPRTFFGGGSRWGNYILKFVHVEDERLAERRLAMSQPTIAAAKEFWNWITGRWGQGTKLRDLMAEQGLLEED